MAILKNILFAIFDYQIATEIDEKLLIFVKKKSMAAKY
jgi:hypothetical protein